MKEFMLKLLGIADVQAMREMNDALTEQLGYKASVINQLHDHVRDMEENARKLSAHAESLRSDLVRSYDRQREQQEQIDHLNAALDRTNQKLYDVSRTNQQLYGRLGQYIRKYGEMNHYRENRRIKKNGKTQNNSPATE